MANIIRKFWAHWNFSRFASNVFYLVKYDLYEREREIVFQAKDEAIEDIVFEYEEDLKLAKRLLVLGKLETVQALLDSPKSFARYGDGEISIIQGGNAIFQKYDSVLAQKLLNILQFHRDNLYVGLNHAYFHSPLNYSESNYRFYRLNCTKYRRFFVNVCDVSSTYLDAAFYGGYYSQREDFDFDSLYLNILELFRDKRIAFVAGEGLLKKLKHDVFKYSLERMVVPAPTRDAFSSYNEIIAEIRAKVPKDFLVCLALGPTATVMAADLADMGYVAWDIGHLPKDYDAYMDKPERNIKNKCQFFCVD